MYFEKNRSFPSDGCCDTAVRKCQRMEVPGTVQYGRILHSSSMEQYCYAQLGYRINIYYCTRESEIYGWILHEWADVFTRAEGE